MRAFKLFAPLLLLPLIAGLVYYFWKDSEHGVRGEKQVWDYLGPIDLDFADRLVLRDDDQRLLEAFDFSRDNVLEFLREYPQEWWYLNTHLVDQQNRRYGLMVALLKTGQVLASMTLVDHDKHFSFHDNDAVEHVPGEMKIIGPATILSQPNAGEYFYRFNFTNEYADIKLDLKANKEPLAVGGTGVIEMGESGRSYYYSLTNMSVAGEGRIRDMPVLLSGKGWMDHQWGQWNDKEFDQWHWFSIQLSDNTEILIFEFRRSSKSVSPLCDLVRPDGSVQHGLTYQVEALNTWVSSKTNRSWSVGWRVRIPEIDAELVVQPDRDDQEVTKALWEGVCTATGAIGGREVKGLAFYEARHRTW